MDARPTHKPKQLPVVAEHAARFQRTMESRGKLRIRAQAAPIQIRCDIGHVVGIGEPSRRQHREQHGRHSGHHDGARAGADEDDTPNPFCLLPCELLGNDTAE